MYVLASVSSNFSVSVYLHPSLLLSRSSLKFNLILRRMTATKPSKCQSIALTACISKAFESIHNREILKRLSTQNLLFDSQYGFL